MALPALETDGREPALGPVSPFARRAPFSAVPAGAAASRPDSARADWRAHPEADDGPAGPPPRDDGQGAEALSRERPATGPHLVTGQLPASSQLASQLASQPASQPDGPEAQGVSRERPATGARSVTEQLPAASQLASQLASQPASQPDGREAQVVSRERPATGASSEPARPPAARAGPAMAPGEPRAVSEGRAAERDRACGVRPCFAREAHGPAPHRPRAAAAPRRCAAPVWAWESLAVLPSVPPRRPMPAPRAADAWRPPIASGSPPEAGRRGSP